MCKVEKTELQKLFELKTPNHKYMGSIEYLQTYCSFLEFQIENNTNKK